MTICYKSLLKTKLSITLSFANTNKNKDIRPLKFYRCAKIITNEHLGYNGWTKIDGYAQIEGLLEIGDLAQILKDIMVLKEEQSSIAEAITKGDRRNTLSHNRYLQQKQRYQILKFYRCAKIITTDHFLH